MNQDGYGNNMSSNKGALSLRFSCRVFDDRYICVKFPVYGTAAYSTDALPTDPVDYKYLYVYLIASETYNYYVEVTTKLGTTTVDISHFLSNLEYASNSINRFWFYVHNNCISIYFNDRWVYSYVMAKAAWLDFPDSVFPTIYNITKEGETGGDQVFTDIRLDEIPDWRDAIYIDYESTGTNALQSVIQQRPIQTLPEIDRGISFTYALLKDEVDGHNILFYNEGEVAAVGMASDGMVYFFDVGMVTSEKTAKEAGLITKVFRLSELDTGGLQAAKTLQTIALGQRHPVKIIMRPDPRLEVLDNLIVNLIASGTNTPIWNQVVIEDITIELEDGKYSSTLTGRRNWIAWYAHFEPS